MARRRMYGLAALALAATTTLPVHDNVAGSKWKNTTLADVRTSILAGGGAYAATDDLSIRNIGLTSAGAISWAAKTQITCQIDGGLLLQNAAGTDFNRLLLGGTTASFPGLFRSGARLEIALANGSADADVIAAIFMGQGGRCTSSGQYTWVSGTNPTVSADTGMRRDAAAIIAATNGGVGSGQFKATSFIAVGAATSAGAGTITYGGTTQLTVGAAGAADPLPANPSGYSIINVAGTNFVHPYYAQS